MIATGAGTCVVALGIANSRCQLASLRVMAKPVASRFQPYAVVNRAQSDCSTMAMMVKPSATVCSA
jgi:hypothetical protein